MTRSPIELFWTAKNTIFTQQKIGIQILLAALNAKTKQTNIERLEFRKFL